MVRFFFRLNNTKVCTVDDASGKSVRQVISKIENIPEEELILVQNGHLLKPQDIVAEFSSIHVSLRLRGGKGGYGNMLKKKAKVTNPNATLDFSACRDLNGRHMRYMNALVAIQKWKERQERFEELKAKDPNAVISDVPLETPKAGVVGWYCEVPCWAEGVKKSRAVFLREQKKQKMCDLWWNARQKGPIPPNADKNWGCPRGDQCDFAHGFDELTGEGRAKFLHEQELKKKREEKEAIEAYTTLKDMSISAIDAIESNFKTQKPKKSQKRANLLAMDDFDPLGFDSFPKKTSKTSNTSKASKSSKKNETPVSEEFRSKLSVLTGDASIQEDGIVSATSSFPSIQLGAIRVVSGRYYFEVHLLTEGLVQIGWASQSHGCDEAEQNGVGDSEESWAFDVARGRKWHGEGEGESYGAACQPGDVVGCLLDADKRTLEYSVNGESLGVAFSGVYAIGGVFPVISLEKEEAVLVNLGQFRFEYAEMERVSSIWEFVKKVNV